MKTGVDARCRALKALVPYLNGESDRVVPPRGASSRDDGLIRELVLGSLRFGRLYDAVTKPFLRHSDPPAPLRAALQIGAHQLLGLDRIPRHAAVATTLDALKQAGHTRYVGAANAILRKIGALVQQNQSPSLIGPLRHLDRQHWPVDLAVRHSLPAPLLADIATSDDLELNRLSQVPEICTRLDDPEASIEHDAILRRDGRWVWWRQPKAALDAVVHSKLGVVQDRTQGHAIELADPQPGERVLDLCAAPGGKTAYLDACGARVMASDRQPSKVVRLARDVTACALVQDGRFPALQGGFDLVVADVPCSNSGVFGRRPEAKDRYDDQHLSSLAEVQQSLVQSAARMVAPGGRLLYCTCSVARPENEKVVAVLADWDVVDQKLTWPDRWHGGGYAAVLKRRS